MLHGAVLVVSAVEGVQPQTRILMRALQRLRVPAVMFVNKIDRRGAGYDRLLQDLFPDVRLTREIGEFGTLLAIDRARQVLGFEPRRSWRDYVSA